MGWPSRWQFCAGLGRGKYLEGAHHFLCGVLQNVAMPQVASGIAFKTDNDAGHRAPVCTNGIFPAGFVDFGEKRRPGVAYLLRTKVLRRVKALAVENLHAGLV